MALILAALFLCLFYCAIAYDSDRLEMVSYIIIVTSFSIVLPLSLYECMRYSDNKFISFELLIKKDLTNYFNKINVNYANRGLEWWVVDGHYWIELRIYDLSSVQIAPTINNLSPPKTL